LISFFALIVFLYVLVDFNRLRRAGGGDVIPFAAAIFLDVFNSFLFFLRLCARH
jgi:FtsH-binding integral membrane protein